MPAALAAGSVGAAPEIALSTASALPSKFGEFGGRVVRWLDANKAEAIAIGVGVVAACIFGWAVASIGTALWFVLSRDSATSRSVRFEHIIANADAQARATIYQSKGYTAEELRGIETKFAEGKPFYGSASVWLWQPSTHFGRIDYLLYRFDHDVSRILPTVSQSAAAHYSEVRNDPAYNAYLRETRNFWYEGRLTRADVVNRIKAYQPPQ